MSLLALLPTAEWVIILSHYFFVHHETILHKHFVTYLLRVVQYCCKYFLHIWSWSSCSYLEIAILRCIYFLEKDPPVASIRRLNLMLRGIADPLASAYAHLYLARRGQVLFPSDSGSFV